MLQKLILITLAGGAGALARYGLSGAVYRFGGSGFPWGTAVVNVVGCFVAGLLWSLFESRWPVSGQNRAVILIGFMGAFTTFSTYILETGELFGDGKWLYGAGNIILQNGMGIVALFCGIALIKVL